MNSVIIGTAGHVDHGKTALIKALNGFSGDEMEIEKERGITIDLSFSNLKHSNGNIAFIDVPGHENLVKTMISGAYAFDCAMLVVASDDGIMPQSKEHVQILSILGVKSLILCITKCDLSDEKRQMEVAKECQELIQKYENLEILNTFFISAKTGKNVDCLKDYLYSLKPKNRKEDGIFHYYIDRLFTLKGLGVVVTGSLINGSIKKGDKIFSPYNEKIISVKNVQIHGNSVDVALAPNRVALNLDVKLSELQKGQILTQKGFFRGFQEIDTLFYGEISHKANVLFCVGSSQIPATALILKDLDEKNAKLVKFKFPTKQFLKFDEPFVCLLNSRVCGGGRVLNAIEEPLKKQSKILLLLALAKRDFNKAFEILSAFHKHGFGLYSAYQRFAMSKDVAVEYAKMLKNVIFDEENLCIYDKSAVFDIKELVKFIISKNPNAIFSPSSIALKISWASQNLVLLALNELCDEKFIEQKDGVFIKYGVDLSQIFSNLEGEIYAILNRGGITPQAPYNIYDDLDIDRKSGDNALKKLCASKKVIRLQHNLFVTSENLNQILKKLYEILQTQGFADVGNTKTILNISRKFAVAYLEYLDHFGDVENIDNKRYLKK